MTPFAGKDRKPAIDALMQAYEYKYGQVYDHRDIAHIIGVAYPSHAYFGIVQSWRNRLMKEKNIDLICVRDVGYRVLEEPERVHCGTKDFRQSVRGMGYAVNRIGAAETAKLPESERKMQDHALRLGAALVNEGRKVSRQVAVAGKLTVLPKVKVNE